jgi:hypothetical protein
MTLYSSFNLTLGQYIRRRNGVPLGADRSLRNMLHRSIGAKNFATFWMYWNPIFGYYLGKYIFKPLRQHLPTYLALLSTFIFCGLIHDLVTTILRGEISLFFTQWFLLMGLWVILSNTLRQDFSNQTWTVKATMNMLPIVISFLIILYFNKLR